MKSANRQISKPTSGQHFPDSIYLFEMLATIKAETESSESGSRGGPFCFFLLLTLVTGPRRSLRLKLSDTIVYEP